MVRARLDTEERDRAEADRKADADVARAESQEWQAKFLKSLIYSERIWSDISWHWLLTNCLSLLPDCAATSTGFSRHERWGLWAVGGMLRATIPHCFAHCSPCARVQAQAST